MTGWDTFRFADNIFNGVVDICIITFVLYLFVKQSRFEKARKSTISCINNETRNFNATTLEIIAVTHIVSFLWGSIIWVASVIVAKLDSQNNTNNNDDNMIFILNVTTLFLSCIGAIGLLSFVCYRLYVSFENTIFEISRCCIIFLIVSLVIAILLTLTLLMTFSMVQNATLTIENNNDNNNNDNDSSHHLTKWEYYYDCIFLLAIFVVVMIPIVVSFLFARKLFGLTMMIRESIHVYCVKNGNLNVTDSDSNGNNKQGLNINEFDTLSRVNSNISDRQANLLQTITKQTLLTLFQSTFCIIYLIGIIFVGRMSHPFVWFIGNTLVACSTVVVPVCVWLSFSFANKEYFIVCKQCHEICYYCFQRLAIRQLDKIHSRNNKIIMPNVNLNVDHCNDDQNQNNPYMRM